MRCEHSPRPASRRVCITRGRSGARTCSTAPSSSQNSAASTRSLARPASCSSSPRLNASTSSAAGSKLIESMLSVTPQCPANDISQTVANSPPSDRSWYASTSGASSCSAAKKLFSSAGSSRSGQASPSAACTCARIEPPRRFLPRPRSTSTSSVSPASLRSCGVSVPRASSTGAKAETMSDSGATTSFPSQAVRMDRESLPTGIEMPSAGQSSSATARTVS